MNKHVEAFDNWIRTSFSDINTELENIYFAQEDRSAVESAGEELRTQLLEQGREHIVTLLKEGNTDEGFDQAFGLLGDVGFYMAACRRHLITEPSRERTSPLVEASALAMELGTSLGMVPRFATSHLATHNPAVNGIYKCFTKVAAEHLFLSYNTRSIFAYKRAADALARIRPLGISHPASYYLLKDAKVALENIIEINAELYKLLDVDRFFYSVRPYYKPIRVGRHEYRGANAGDFAGINEIDILLGLCSANNISYSQLLVDKFLYLRPGDQERLRDVLRRTSLLDSILEIDKKHCNEDWYQRNVGLFIEVADAHGRTSTQHHDQLINKFIEKPSSALPEEDLEHITASGPPLPVLLDALEKLRDLRTAAKRDDIPSRYADFEKLRERIK